MSRAPQLAHIDDDAQWDALTTNSVGGTIFAGSAWLRCAQEAFAVPVQRLGCVHQDRLTAGVAGLEQRRGPLRRLITPPLTPHGGFHFLHPSQSAPARIESAQHHAVELLAARLQADYGHVHLVHAPAVQDMRPLVWSGWSTQVRYTYQLPLDDSQHIWDRFERRTRTVIRKAQNAGWESCASTDVALLGDLYQRIYTGQRIRPPVATASLMRMVQRVLAADLGYAVAVRDARGETAAMVVFVRDGATLYAWVAGADPQHKASGAVSLLYWEVLRRSEAITFDFVGANLPAIARFKRGFGGVLVPYFASQWYRSGWLRAAIPLWQSLRSAGV